ncbi:Importin subunit alpha-1a [Vitis vinifera]|uniref:Importin subunit alpha-1a n=1 Tax=Vitis vinifera TaxID=29760 RepID=A0A438FQI5_VITVI|nr:Importin subunit alpha-1a [Vitis vinifera]
MEEGKNHWGPTLFVILYEDELADSGVSLLTVKVRVMPTCCCWREATFQALSAKGYPSDSTAYNDPSTNSQRLPIIMHKTQKLKEGDARENSGRYCINTAGMMKTLMLQTRTTVVDAATKPALPALGRLIHSNDEDVLTDACWALSYLSDGTNDKVQAVIEAGVCPRVVELLLYSSPSVLIPALRMVGNIVTGDDMQTQCIINHQALLCLLNPLTNNHKKSIKKEACWTISNITASNKEQIQAVIEANIIGPSLFICFKMLKTNRDWVASTLKLAWMVLHT